MAKKVTISIPDMLHEKLVMWLKSFNLSKMPQDAVPETIQKNERFQKRIREDLDLGQIVKQLRKEKMRSDGNYFECGKNDEILWPKTSRYDDLQYTLHWNNLKNATKDKIHGDYFCHIHASNLLLNSNPHINSEYFLNYPQGWKQGIGLFWEEVREKL